METAIVIGAGMVGLLTAWHLQEHGVEVTVIDRTGVAAGASWGNAGYLAPAKTIPLALRIPLSVQLLQKSETASSSRQSLTLFITRRNLTQ